MKKKMLTLLTVMTLGSALTGCCISHEWKDATCTSPKTCVKCEGTEGEALPHTWVEATCSKAKHCEVCGTTEGEALPHTWIDATYQTAKTCEVCGTTEGEPLTPDFVKHNLSADCELDTEYDFLTTGYDDRTVALPGKVVFSDYKVLESDENHEAKEGYEWKTITISITFGDEYYGNGYLLNTREDSYYIIEPADGNTEMNPEGEGDAYTVNWNGVDYTECICDIHSEFERDKKLLTIQYYFLLPIGYDGQTAGIYHTDVDPAAGEYFYDNPLAKDGLVFRLD